MPAALMEKSIATEGRALRFRHRFVVESHEMNGLRGARTRFALPWQRMEAVSKAAKTLVRVGRSVGQGLCPCRLPGVTLLVERQGQSPCPTRSAKTTLLMQPHSFRTFGPRRSIGCGLSGRRQTQDRRPAHDGFAPNAPSPNRESLPNTRPRRAPAALPRRAPRASPTMDARAIPTRIA